MNRCSLCRNGTRCAFHRARSPEELGQAFVHALQTSGAVGLARLIEASMSGLTEAIPMAVRATLGLLDDEPLEAEWQRVMSRAELTPNHLRRIAALSLTLAMLDESGSETVEVGRGNQEAR